jgi:hypothetical protein
VSFASQTTVVHSYVDGNQGMQLLRTFLGPELSHHEDVELFIYNSLEAQSLGHVISPTSITYDPNGSCSPCSITYQDPNSPTIPHTEDLSIGSSGYLQFFDHATFNSNVFVYAAFGESPITTYLDENQHRFADLSRRVYAGYVIVCENAVSEHTPSGCQDNNVSDVLWFPEAGRTNQGTVSVAYSNMAQFISDSDSDRPDGIADRGNIQDLVPPNTSLPNTTFLIERLFPDALITYTPVAGQPGFAIDPVDHPLTYTAQSDCSPAIANCQQVAEPPSYTCFALGIGFLVILKLGQQRRVQAGKQRAMRYNLPDWDSNEPASADQALSSPRPSWLR